MRKSIVLIIPLLFFGIIGCTSENRSDDVLVPPSTMEYDKEVEIIDISCSASYASFFYFSFILQNSRNEDINISYYWTLIDSKAYDPGFQMDINKPSPGEYQGQGVASLLALGASEVKIGITQIREYDPRFFVMYVSVYRDGVLVGYYRGQKST